MKKIALIFWSQQSQNEKCNQFEGKITYEKKAPLYYCKM